MSFRNVFIARKADYPQSLVCLKGYKISSLMKVLPRRKDVEYIRTPNTVFKLVFLFKNDICFTYCQLRTQDLFRILGTKKNIATGFPISYNPSFTYSYCFLHIVE